MPKIVELGSLSAIVVYNDAAVSRDSVLGSWLAAAAYKRYPTVPRGTVISTSFLWTQPMEAKALWVHISVFNL